MPDVYTLDDLKDWDKSKVSLAVLGHPVQHSISPEMHNAALEALMKEHKQFSDWKYYKFDVPAEHLREALPKFRKAGFKGLNLTVPHKIDAVDYVDEVDPESLPLGAVNTLHAKGKGYYGYNTDGFGLLKSLTASFPGLGSTPFLGRKVVLLGAGGAARSAAMEAIRSECNMLYIGNRDQTRRTILLEKLDSQRAHGFDIANPPSEIYESAIIINATSLGLNVEDPSPIQLDQFAATTYVYDMIYNQPETALKKSARECGLPYTGGLGMLVWQGARALAIWLEMKKIENRKAENYIAPIMQAAGEKALNPES